MSSKRLTLTVELAGLNEMGTGANVFSRSTAWIWPRTVGTTRLRGLLPELNGRYVCFVWIPVKDAGNYGHPLWRVWERVVTR